MTQESKTRLHLALWAHVDEATERILSIRTTTLQPKDQFQGRKWVPLFRDPEAEARLNAAKEPA